MRGTPSPAAAGLAYIDALRAAEAAAPILSYALERSRGDRRAAQAEAILHVAEAVSALQEAQTQGALERDAVGALRQVAVMLAAGICPPAAKPEPEPEPEPEPDGADSEGGECDVLLDCLLCGGEGRRSWGAVCRECNGEGVAA